MAHFQGYVEAIGNFLRKQKYHQQLIQNIRICGRRCLAAGVGKTVSQPR